MTNRLTLFSLPVGEAGSKKAQAITSKLNPIAAVENENYVHQYEVRPRKDKRDVDLISDVLPFGRLWYDTPDNAIGYAMHSSRPRSALIRAYDAAGNVMEISTPSRAGWTSKDFPLFRTSSRAHSAILSTI